MFDTIDHTILLDKMYHYGFKNTELMWFKSYLSQRKQVVSYNGVTSSAKVVSIGVPQGTVIEPMLFLLFESSSASSACFPTWEQLTCLDGSLSQSNNVGLLHHFADQVETPSGSAPACHPGSMRNRCVLFQMYGWEHQIRRLLQHCRHPPTVSDDLSFEPTEDDSGQAQGSPCKNRCCSTRVVKVTPDMVAAAFAVPGVVADVRSDRLPDMTIYQQFCERLVMDGTILWRMHTDTVDVVVMNDFCADTGCFQPTSFVHVSMVRSPSIEYFACTSQT